MKILIAHADRDLLSCFKDLFEKDGFEVVTAFDGPQVINDIYKNTFDCVILDDNIPRMPSANLIRILNERSIPVLILSQKKITYNILLENELANSYLSFPFLPYELKSRLSNVIEMKDSVQRIDHKDVFIEPGKFLLNGKCRITFEEAKLFTDLIDGSVSEADNLTVYVNSLNKKFALCGCETRIKYVLNQGYRMVTLNE